LIPPLFRDTISTHSACLHIHQTVGDIDRSLTANRHVPVVIAVNAHSLVTITTLLTVVIPVCTDRSLVDSIVNPETISTHKSLVDPMLNIRDKIHQKRRANTQDTEGAHTFLRPTPVHDIPPLKAKIRVFVLVHMS
jgi:hypothetical protein